MACHCFIPRGFLILSAKDVIRSQQYYIKPSNVYSLTWLSYYFRSRASCNLSVSASNDGSYLPRPLKSVVHLTNGVVKRHPEKNIPLTDVLHSGRYYSSEAPKNLSKDITTDQLYKEEKTKLTIINENVDGKSRYPYVFKYSNRGFVIGSNQIIGSVALVKECVFSWKVFSHHQITPASLSLFTAIHPKLEVLVLGLGDKVAKLSPEVYEFLRKEKIPVEVLDTPNACATYNFLTEEGRITAAGLIPPQNLNLY